jgi:hypothetical protein
VADATPLVDLPLAGGLRFGLWSVWRSDWACEGTDFDLLLVLPARDWCVRVPIEHSGWVDFRVKPGEWYTAYGDGSIAPDSPRLEEPLADFDRRQPAAEWPIGRFVADDWAFEVEPDRLRIRHPLSKVPLVFWRDRPLWTREKKPLPGCEG